MMMIVNLFVFNFNPATVLVQLARMRTARAFRQYIDRSKNGPTKPIIAIGLDCPILLPATLAKYRTH